MMQQAAQFARPLLESTQIRKVRRNHGLEHATIHILTRRVKGVKMSGRSSANGFILIGDVSTIQVEAAVNDALQRMRNGEQGLAIHPNCGTNLVTTGMLTSVVALANLSGPSRVPGDRFARLLVSMMLAILISQPLGMSLQRHFTTDGDPGDLDLVKIKRSEFKLPFAGRAFVIHNVETRGG